MVTSGRISKYRDRLDRTLASPDLTDPTALKSLLKTHLLSTSLDGTEECGEALLERRTSEVSDFLDMLRSASVKSDGPKAGEKSHADWKLKQDNEEFRVMYREGPPGSPFHTLLAEGYIDGPIDACLCVSWESTLYKKWWPQYNVPSFKIVSSQRVHKIRIGEEISLVRVKVSWPLSAREALFRFFEFEYFQDDLIIVLLNTIDDSESIDRITHGYSRDMAPEANDVVRVGAIGGFALQKVNPGRSYFRTIASMDLKLDFVPPSLINFISRQLIGSGFRLYQKAISTVFNTDDDFKKPLGDPLYARIRDALYSKSDASDGVQKTPAVEFTEELLSREMSDEMLTIEVAPEIHAVENEAETASHGPAEQNGTTARCEIEEEEGIGETQRVEEKSRNETYKGKVCISPEVEQALGTLEKVIAMVREYGWNDRASLSSDDDQVFEYYKEAAAEKSTPAGGRTSSSSRNRTTAEAPNNENREGNLDEPRNSSGRHNLRSKKSNSLREVNHNKVAPASPVVEGLVVAPSETEHDNAVYSTEKAKTEETDHPSIKGIIAREEINVNGTDPVKKMRNRRRKNMLCCFHPSSMHSVVS